MQRLQRSFWSIYGRFVWEKHQSVWKQQQIERVVSTLQNLSHGSSKRVLDAGCGTGEYAAALAKAGFVVVGVDYAPGMLLHAEKKVEPDLSERLLFQQMRLDKNLLFRDGEFDHVINISALQLMPDPMFTLKETVASTQAGRCSISSTCAKACLRWVSGGDYQGAHRPFWLSKLRRQAADCCEGMGRTYGKDSLLDAR